MPKSYEPQPHICGFCMTGHHQNCKESITYYDKVWTCHCPCKDKV